MPGANGLYVGRNKLHALLSGVYTSPYLLEILSTRPGAPAFVVGTGALTANTGQPVSCSRASSAYCSDGSKLVLLGPNTVRVEPTGLLVEGQSTNYCLSSNAIGDANWSTFGAAPTITLNTSDVTDPTGGNAASKLVWGAVASGQAWVYQLTGMPAGRGCESVWLRTASGTATIYLIDRSDHVQACVVTATWQRFSFTDPTTGNPAYFVLGYGNDSGNAGYGAGGTFYAWGAQNEQELFPTSNIVTTGAPATRSADVVSVANPLQGLNPGTWRIGATLTPLSAWADVDTANASLGTTILDLGNFGVLNSADLRMPAGGLGRFQVTDASAAKTANYTGMNSGSVPVVALARDQAGALSISPGVFTSTTGTGTGLLPTQPATVFIGTRSTPAQPAWSHLTDILVDNT